MQAVTVQGKNKVRVKKMKAPEIQEGTDMITHQVPLKQAEKMYKMFNDRADGCIKVVMKP